MYEHWLLRKLIVDTSTRTLTFDLHTVSLDDCSKPRGTQTQANELSKMWEKEVFLELLSVNHQFIECLGDLLTVSICYGRLLT